MFFWVQTISLTIPDTSSSCRHGKLLRPVHTDTKSGTETYVICDRSDFKIGVAHMTVDMCERKSYPRYSVEVHPRIHPQLAPPETGEK